MPVLVYLSVYIMSGTEHILCPSDHEKIKSPRAERRTIQARIRINDGNIKGYSLMVNSVVIPCEILIGRHGNTMK